MKGRVAVTQNFFAAIEPITQRLTELVPQLTHNLPIESYTLLFTKCVDTKATARGSSYRTIEEQCATTYTTLILTNFLCLLRAEINKTAYLR
jgi:hypothetical protein